MVQLKRENWKGKYYWTIRDDIKKRIVMRGHAAGKIKTRRQVVEVYSQYHSLTPGLHRYTQKSWQVVAYSQELKYDKKNKKIIGKPVKGYGQPKVKEYLKSLPAERREGAGKARVQYYMKMTVKGKEVVGLSDSVPRSKYKAGRKQAYNRFVDALSYQLIGHTDAHYAQDWLDKHGSSRIDEGIKWYTPKTGREVGYYAKRDWETPLRDNVYAVASESDESYTDIRFRY